MPPLAAWSYRPEWDEQSPEKQLTEYYLKPHDWLSILK
jgi:coproporphyrinogen III oxidase